MKLTRSLVALTLLASGFLVVSAIACDLNPQPLPPGDQSEGGVLGATSSGSGATASSSGTNTSGGSGSGTSSGGGSSGGEDGGTIPLGPVGDGSVVDATSDVDGATDAPSDAEVDATLDDGSDS